MNGSKKPQASCPKLSYERGKFCCRRRPALRDGNQVNFGAEINSSARRRPDFGDGGGTAVRIGR